jgi:hypothetical protein
VALGLLQRLAAGLKADGCEELRWAARGALWRGKGAV